MGKRLNGGVADVSVGCAWLNVCFSQKKNKNKRTLFSRKKGRQRRPMLSVIYSHDTQARIMDRGCVVTFDQGGDNARASNQEAADTSVL